MGNTKNMFEGATVIKLVGVNGLSRRKNKKGEPFGAPRFLQPASSDVIKAITDENGFLLGTAQKPEDIVADGNLWISYEATDEEIVDEIQNAQPVKGAPLTIELYVAFRSGIERDHRDDDRVFTTVSSVILGVKSAKLFNAATDGAGFVVRDRQVPTTPTTPAAPAGGVQAGADAAAAMALLGQLLGKA